jgi:hypothetical protein
VIVPAFFSSLTSRNIRRPLATLLQVGTRRFAAWEDAKGLGDARRLEAIPYRAGGAYQQKLPPLPGDPAVRVEQQAEPVGAQRAGIAEVHDHVALAAMCHIHQRPAQPARRGPVELARDGYDLGWSFVQSLDHGREQGVGRGPTLSLARRGLSPS